MVKLNEELVSGSIVLLIAFNIFNFLNFLFQFVMARFLTPSEYGTLAALLSITYMANIFSDSIQTIITKYSSKEKDLGKIKNLFRRTFKKAVVVSIVLFTLFIFAAIILANIWEAPYSLVLSMGIVIFACLLSPISRGIMQGKKKFRSLGANLILESSLKVIISVVFVLLGFKVFGAVIGLVVSSIIAFLVSVFQIRDILNCEEKNMEVPSVYQQSILVFIFTLAVTLFYSLDIIIAKAVFSPENAGYYALASILGKIVFWGTQPISRAMLPIASEKNEKKKKNKIKSVFYSSLAILTLGLIVVLFMFYQFPELIVKIFSGKELLDSSNILFKIGIAMALLSYSNLLLFYKISLTKESKDNLSKDLGGLGAKAGIFAVLIILEAGILYLSSGSLVSFSNGLILSAIMFLLGSLAIVLYKNEN